MDPASIRICGEDEKTVSYAIGFRKEAMPAMLRNVPLQTILRIGKRTKSFERVDVITTEAFRLMLIAKIKAFSLSVDFSVVNPEFPPQMTAMRGTAEASVLFRKVTGDFESRRSEHRRVKPYDERFEVKVGDLKVLDF